MTDFSKAFAEAVPWPAPNKLIASVGTPSPEAASIDSAAKSADSATLSVPANTTEPSSTNPKDKFGGKKPPFHLIPSSPLLYLAMVMKLGATKYGAYNWRDKAVRLTVYLSAAERHLRAILDGEAIDPESGMPHAAHVMACMAIILDAGDLGCLVDDRPPPGKFAEILDRLLVAPAASGG